jgi:hypothetical protein
LLPPLSKLLLLLLLLLLHQLKRPFPKPRKETSRLQSDQCDLIG